MSGITFYPKDLKNNRKLSISDIVLLKTIYLKEKQVFKAFIESATLRRVLEVLKKYEDYGYIKITDEIHSESDMDNIVIRQALDEMFKEEINNADEVLTYLNYKITSGGSSSKKGFSLKSSANKKFINARLAEGYSVEELKMVIDSKFREWSKTDFAMYLRPETLFNPTKFGSYLVKAYGDKENTGTSNFTLSTED